VSELWESLVQLFAQLGVFLGLLLQLLASWSLVIVWIAWWLWGVNWKKAWPVLAQGAWAGVLLIGVVVTLAWSQIAPSSCTLLRIFVVPNFWWQLGAVAGLIAIALFCGWLQGVMGWTPAEISLEPPAAASHEHAHH
jgi:hypothetical protein